jgi:hypothetical protein
MEARLKAKTEMTEFMDDDVDVKLSDLKSHRLRIDAKLKHSHQVYSSIQFVFFINTMSNISTQMLVHTFVA